MADEPEKIAGDESKAGASRPGSAPAEKSIQPPASKEITADDLRGVAEEISSHYPPPRLGTELVLLEVDPHRAHAYWNVDLHDFQEGKALAGEGQHPLVLRMQDITGGGAADASSPQAFDVEVQGLQSHWYIDLWQPGRTYVADLGFRKEDGTLVSLARSNPVDTPRAAQSENYDTAAVHTGHGDDEGPLLTDLLTHHEEESEDEDETTVIDVAADVPVTDSTQLAPANESKPGLVVPRPVAPAYGSTVESFPLVDAMRPEMHEGAAPTVPEAPAFITNPPRQEVRMEIGGEKIDASQWPTAAQTGEQHPDVQGKVEAYYSQFTKGDSPISEAHLSSEQNIQQETPQAPPEAPSAQADAAKPLPLESYVNLSSFDVGRPDVMLEVNTELHIYGRAKPGTELTLYGQKVHLRPDGTFSIRKPLPQGAVVVPLLFSGPADTKSEG